MRFTERVRPMVVTQGGRALGIAIALTLLSGMAAIAATTGKIQGKIIASDSGEPIGFADVLLIPADTTLRRVGGLTNADGTFLLEAAPGRYTLQFRAISYATKRIEGVEIKAGQLLPFNTGLSSDAIQQEEVVVEAKALQNTESALLSARKKSSSLNDGISVEQVRKSPDKDAAEVLRRVTGISVQEGKFVFVRGLGERYSSTEVDGVRLASPEQNKRVVPLDLVPANLLDNIVIQKTYTADRPGEFGGGDVQVKTKDFPGHRTLSFSISQGFSPGVTFANRRTYASGRADIFGYGSKSRAIPDEVAGQEIDAGAPAPVEMAQSFKNTWSTSEVRNLPSGGYTATYGDEWKAAGRPLGMILSWGVTRNFDEQDEVQRFYQGSFSDTTYSYDVTRWTESVQNGGLSALSYRISPRHSLHLRGIYTNNAEDEVRFFQGLDKSVNAVHRSTRLQYIQRTVLSGSLEGRHDLTSLLDTRIDWKLTGSQARRQQPDRREYIYDEAYYFPGDKQRWVMASTGMREWGDMRDRGWGTTINGSLPYKLGRLGSGKLALGYDHQVKKRDHFYRRLYMNPALYADREAPPESLFADEQFEGDFYPATLLEWTYNDPAVLSVDNYFADQKISATYGSLDVPLGRRVRANLGLRVESGLQDVRNYPIFHPEIIVAEGKIDETDVLPSGNLTVSVTDAVNLRLAASRTISRPDLNELSPTGFFEYTGGMLQRGNSDLKRAQLTNYDVRFEIFPALSEVLAVGYFYKDLHDPIEQTLVAGSSYTLLEPRNSKGGYNRGVELEARFGLGRMWKPLSGLSLNANASVISSQVDVQVSSAFAYSHPLQGQASRLLNGALSYTRPGGMDATVMINSSGKRLQVLGLPPLPDIYSQPFTTLDATMGFPLRSFRVKLAAKNLTDPLIQSLQGEREASAYRTGRTYSVALAFGS